MQAVKLDGPVPAESSRATVRVWDPVVRIFHWTLAFGLLANMTVFDDGEQIHKLIGYVVLGAIAVRLAWGFIGTPHARFSSFIPTAQGLVAYLRLLLRGREPRHVGHNPAASVMMVTLAMLMTLTGLSGWMMGTEALWGVEWVEEIHEALAEATVVLVAVHVLAAVLESFRHRENLILSMINGRKRPASGTDVDHATPSR